MAKRKEIKKLPDVSKQNYELIKAGVKVFPEYMKDSITKKWSWYILYSENGKVVRFNKIVNQNELNLSIHKSILHLYKNIIQKNDI